MVDPNTNHVYFWNPDTNEVSWTLPEGGVLSVQQSAGGEEDDGEDIDELLGNYPHLKRPPVDPNLGE